SGNYKLYKMSLYLAAKGNNVDEAKHLATGVLSSLHSNGIEAKYTINYNEQLIKSIIPTGNNHLPGKEILVPGPAAAASFPFSSSFYDIDEEEGILLGFNSNNIPIAKSIWKLPKYIGAVIGSTGSGKSYAAKALILNERMANDTKVFILDPEDEYTEMCKMIPKSQVIRINKDSKNIPNLLSLNGVELLEKLMVLPRIFNVLLGGLSESQKPLLERCLVKAYLAKGIKEDDERTHSKKAPKLSDLYKIMEQEKNKCKDHSLKNDYEIMLNRLGRYCTGIFKFMNTDNSGILKESKFVVFEFKSMPLEIRAVLMMTLLEFINGRFRSTDDKKMLVLDEAWRVLKSREEAEYIENFARTFRKNNGSLILITQSVAELENSQEGKAFLSNAAFKYIFKTEGAVIEETAKCLD
ncbi:MAG: ATP-binding protein, partial [Candidatus Woesearchaeota archaeon]